MQKINSKDVLVYTTMPRIVPRLKDFFASGFAYFSFWMAHIYYMVRLLPAHHPYLLSENIGRYGIRNVIVEATRHLTFSRKNIDQILVYFGLLGGVVMLITQIVILLYTLLVTPALAFSWFDTPDPATDIVYNLLDRVFGVPGVFCSSFTPANCTNYSAGLAFNTPGPATGATVLPLPFHSALHDLFQFYSTALLLVATLIFLYFIVVVIFETVTSGTPFGKRFQNVWVPIRLIMAVGLLVPLNFGLNSGQYIVLYLAKYGSSFATVGWNEFNAGIQGHSLFSADPDRPIGERYTLLAIPQTPDIAPLVEAMTIIHACAYSYIRIHARGFNETSAPMIDLYPDATYPHHITSQFTDFRVVPFLVKTKTGGMIDGPIFNIGLPDEIDGEDDEYLYIPDETTVTYTDAVGFYFGGDIIIRFGERAMDVSGSPKYQDEVGNVRPLCGDIRIPVSDLRDIGGAVSGSPAPRGGADHMLKTYYEMVLKMWFDDPEIRQFARSYVTLAQETDYQKKLDFCNGNESVGGASLSGTGTPYPGFYGTPQECAQKIPTALWRQEKINEYVVDIQAAILEAWGRHIQNSTDEDADPEVVAHGWGGAGIWYSKIAEVNGGWVDSALKIPTLHKYPHVMEQVRDQNKQSNETVEFKRQFTMSTKAQSGEDAPEGYVLEEPSEIGKTLADLFTYWNDDIKDLDGNTRKKWNNIALDAMNLLFGTQGLMAMRTANANLHPLVQLTLVGKGLVDSAITNLAVSTGSAFLGGLLAGMEKYDKIKALGNAASQVLLSTAFMGLTAGFVLFYVLPFMPFIYFFFAIASWVKAVFEAMVGVPLWALAHLRIDGEGLPGDAAQNGYFLLLEIFIRPILTVFGLVAAVIIFSTQVRILNLIWDLVTVNLGGNTVGYSSDSPDILGMYANGVSPGITVDSKYQRGIIDQFFFTVIYTIVCYMMALASFKLIDRIPDNILRWAGAGVSSFGDINQDQIESLNRYVAMGGMTIGNQAAGAVTQLGAGVGGAIGKEFKKLGEDGAKQGATGPAAAAPGGAATPGAASAEAAAKAAQNAKGNKPKGQGK